MSIPILAFSTFLKLATQPTSQQLRDIQMYGKPGGYDRYRSLKEGVTDFIQHKKPADQIRQRNLKLRDGRCRFRGFEAARFRRKRPRRIIEVDLSGKLCERADNADAVTRMKHLHPDVQTLDV